MTQEKLNDAILWEIWLSRLDLPALAVADEIHLFEKVSTQTMTVSALANILLLDEKGIDALTTFLASMNLLVKNFDEIQLSELSKNYLLPSSPAYWGATLVGAKNSTEYKRLLASLRQSKNSQLTLNGNNVTSQWEEGAISYEDAKQFTSIMHCTIYSAAENAIASGLFDGTQSLLDIGAGSGCFISLFLKKYSDRMTGIFDLPEVCRVAKEHLAETPCLDKVKLYPGNFFKNNFPRGFDGILFSNIFHDWPIETARFLAKKAYEALPPGGKIFIHEMLLNDKKDAPKVAAAFNVLMYMNHGSQQFSMAELITILEEVGFSKCYEAHTHPFFSMVVGIK